MEKKPKHPHMNFIFESEDGKFKYQSVVDSKDGAGFKRERYPKDGAGPKRERAAGPRELGAMDGKVVNHNDLMFRNHAIVWRRSGSPGLSRSELRLRLCMKVAIISKGIRT
ncbi:hypothetical protein AMTR_s00002p00165530 [Amborella trichopoda]|uniref:Uncharacterized protein n=1 Tax=Amborella trichopoda TaxID=13333 RepID=W1NTY1_AMBTC|nr:hypothetical protein AMTR_s00002p00165530 [Amborella trichopoda]